MPSRYPLSRATARLAITLLLGLPVVAIGIAQPEVAAQDWGATGGDKKAEIVKRYKELLEKNPTEGFVLKQLLKEVGQGRGLERLIEEYRAKADKQPNSLKYQLILGHLNKAAQRYPEALAAYEKAAEINAKSADAWLGLGLTLQLSKRHNEAQDAFEKALSLLNNRDRKQDVLRKLADIAFNQRKWDDADRYYQQLIKLDSANEFLRLEYAEVLVKHRRYEQALAQYEAIEKLAGRNVKARVTAMKDRGDVLAIMDRGDDAIALWRRAMKLVAADSYLRRELQQRVIDVYRARDDIGGILAEYEKAWKNPNYDQAMTLAGLYDEVGREDDALRTYRKAVARNRGSVDARLKIIRILERKGDTNGVIKEYRDLIRVEPKQASYGFELAEIYWRLGDKRKALAEAEAVSRRHGGDPYVHGNLADLYLRWGERAKALAVYQKLVRIAPSDPNNLISLGEFYWQEGQRDKALATWKRILKQPGDKAEAHATLAQVYADHNLIKEAVAEYDKALKLSNDDDHLLRGLAQAYERARQLEKAITIWRQLIDTSSREHLKREARSRSIALMYRLGTLRARLLEFRKAWEGKGDREAGYFLGEAYIVLKDFARAEEVFQSLLESNGSDIEALLSLNKVYTDTGEHKKNIGVLKRLAELQKPRARDYYHQIAELSLKLYEDDQAVKFAKDAVDINPNDARGRARLGAIYRQMQDLDAAAKEYNAAIELDPLAYEHYFALAEIYVSQDKIRKADQLYRQLAKKARDESMVLRAGRKAIDINDSLGTLEQLETDLAPLLSGQRPVFTRLMIELYDRLTRPLIAEAEHGEAESRQEAQKALAAVSRRALGPLLGALKNDEAALRITSVRILGDLRNGNAALPLARLIDESDPNLRVRAALAAGKLGDPRALQPFLRALADTDLTLREIAVWALGRMRSKDAVARLHQMLDDGGWTLRAMAAIALGRIGDSRSLPLLGDRLASARTADEKPEVRVAAAWALSGTKNDKAQAYLVKAVLEDRDPRVRRMAAWALGRLGTPQARDALLDVYWTADPQVREVAGKALLGMSRAGDTRPPYVAWEENLGFFEPRTNTVDVGFFLEVLLSDELLAQGGDGATIITDGEKAITRILSQQLGGKGERKLALLLAELDQDDEQLSLGALTWRMPTDSKQRAAVNAALDRIGKAIAPKLIPLLSSKNNLVRLHAAGVLGKVGETQATKQLIAALDDEDKDVRRKAADALGRLGDKSARDPLLARLKDEYWASRAHAALALGRLGDRAATDHLTRALTDPFPWVQASAAEGLGLLGDQRAVPALVERLDEAVAPVKVQVLRALSRIGGSDAKKALDKYKNDPDPRIRDAVGGPS